VAGADSAAGDDVLCRKGVDAASCAFTKGEAASKTVAIASKRMVFFSVSPCQE
jgi:hypothetical protein